MTAKRKPVTMPAKPPYYILKAMVGDPMILAASDESLARYWYRACRSALKDRATLKAKRK